MSVFRAVDHRLIHHRLITTMIIVRKEVEVDQIVAHQNILVKDVVVAAVTLETLLMGEDIIHHQHCVYQNHNHPEQSFDPRMSTI